MSFWKLTGFHMPETVDNNTVSNIAFLLAGNLAAALLGPEALIWSLSLSYLFLGSAWYHFKDRHMYVWADWSAMYMTFTAQIGYCNFLLDGSYLPMLVALIVGVWLSAINPKIEKIKYFNISLNFIVIGILYTTTLAQSFLLMDWPFAVASAALYAVAFGSRTIGERYASKGDRLKYDIYHGAWHWIVGIAMVVQIFGLWFNFKFLM